jgi:hypothetical protein
MPNTLWLAEFGSQVWSAFGHPPYLVGSTLRQMMGEDVIPNDVDIRVILPDDEYTAWGIGDPKRPHDNAKWVAFVLAFSELGKRMTGLPIDFQIQQQTDANETTKGNQRSAIGIVPLRIRDVDQPA